MIHLYHLVVYVESETPLISQSVEKFYGQLVLLWEGGEKGIQPSQNPLIQIQTINLIFSSSVNTENDHHLCKLTINGSNTGKIV